MEPAPEPEPHSEAQPKHSSYTTIIGPRTSEPVAQLETGQPSGLSLGFATASRDNIGTKEASKPSIDTDRDIELSSPFSMDEDFGNHHPFDVQVSHIEDIDTGNDSTAESEMTLRAESPLSPGANIPPPSLDQPPGLEIPVTRIRSASSSSAQPTSPGFSRPSVREDPQFNLAQHNSYVETPIQSSLYDSFARPSHQQPVVGSLGESFMQKNAEELMRRRKSSGR